MLCLREKKGVHMLLIYIYISKYSIIQYRLLHTLHSLLGTRRRWMIEIMHVKWRVSLTCWSWSIVSKMVRRRRGCCCWRRWARGRISSAWTITIFWKGFSMSQFLLFCKAMPWSFLVLGKLSPSTRCSSKNRVSISRVLLYYAISYLEISSARSVGSWDLRAWP